MTHEGADLFEQDRIVAAYQEHRHRPDSPNESLEKPIFLELLGDVGGQFIFSVVHPVITASDKSRDGGGIRQEWIVDDYFDSGPRRVYFKGEFVKQFHLTIEQIYRALQDAKYQIVQLRESCPQRANFQDEALFERRKRIPLFLLLSSKKV